MNLARDVKGHKKGFYRYLNSNGKTRENMDLSLNRAGDLMTKDMEKAEVLCAFFVSVYASNLASRNPRFLRVEGKSGVRKTLHEAGPCQEALKQTARTKVHAA